jgi:AmiR/NasT family two-component response regulator
VNAARRQDVHAGAERPLRIALSRGLPDLRSAVEGHPGLAMLVELDGVDSLVEQIDANEPDLAVVAVTDPTAALSALSRLATRDGDLPRTVIALAGAGAADLVHAIRRLGLNADEIDPGSPAVCERLVALARH